jgi:RNA polymerase sigma factor (sigma-70 family)
MPATRLQFTDEEFLDGLRAGDNQVLSAFYKKHYNTVLKFILNNSGSEAEAKDVYQETVIVVYENAQNPAFTLSCRLQTYIYSIARRLWLKQLRQSGRTFLFKEDEENELADVGVAMEEHSSREADLVRMTKSLAELGEPCATLISDFYVRKLSMEEISEKFGYTNADNAKTQKYKCLQRLKRYFFEKSEAEQ